MELKGRGQQAVKQAWLDAATTMCKDSMPIELLGGVSLLYSLQNRERHLVCPILPLRKQGRDQFKTKTGMHRHALVGMLLLLA